MKITEIISESNQSKEALKPRNFVAKNAINTGAGQHKDKKRAEKQGNVKHKKQAVPMDEQSVPEVAGAQKCWPGHKKVGTQPGTGKNKGKRVNDCEKIEEDETRMSRAAKGHEKYGKKGMQALAKAGREGASKEELDAIRDKHDNYNEDYRDHRDAYQRDYDSSISGMDGSYKRDFKRRELEHELGHETNNYAVAINGKSWKVFATRSHAEAVARKIQMKDPSKKVSVHETGSPVTESATAGATSAANVSIGPAYKNKPAKTPKNKDGTAKNALDINANLITGGSIKR